MKLQVRLRDVTELAERLRSEPLGRNHTEGKGVRVFSEGLPSTFNPTHRLPSSSFLGLPYRTLNINHKKELLRSLWVHSI